MIGSRRIVMPYASDYSTSALPRSLALSSLSYLTAVVLLLFARALLPGSAAPPDVPGPVLPPINIVDNFAPVPPGPAPPKVAPTESAGPILPVAPDQAADQPVLARQESMFTPPLSVGTGGTGGNPSASSGGDPGAAEPTDDPRPGDFVMTDTMPVLVKTVLPEYPGIAQQAGMEGSVVLLLLVGKDGRVRKAQVARPGSMFDDNAIAAGRQFVFTPATMNGRPVSVWVAQQIRFVLH
jgi:protein TonB